MKLYLDRCGEYYNLSSVSQNIWNLSSSLFMKREGSLSFLMIFTFIVPELEALYFMQCHRQILVMSELQIKKNSCQTLGPASKRVLPDLSTFCQTCFFFRNFFNISLSIQYDQRVNLKALTQLTTTTTRIRLRILPKGG